jgi:rod shape-determining protein MreC
MASSDSLSGKGLVGKVVKVFPHSAQVQLITDSGASVAAKIQGVRAEGIVEGSVSGQLTMGYVDRDMRVDPKLIIVTSGFGGVYPPDIPIGVVASVGEEDVNIYKQIEVQPFVDFRVLEEVMVLITPTTGSIPTTPTTGGSGTTLPGGSAASTSTTGLPVTTTLLGSSTPSTTTTTTLPTTGR